MQREGTPATRLAAVIALVLLTIVWAWWGAKEGAYFGNVMFPGLILLCAGVVLLSSRSVMPAALELPLPVRIAFWALVGLGVWSAASALWSPSPDVAISDAQRILGYAIAFLLGLWLATLLGERRHLAMVPIAAAALFAGAIALIGLFTGDDFERYVQAGTLQYPIGYRNANAAFFLIALWPALTLATSRDLDWRLRAAALGTATLCLELAALSQSRASMIAAAVALVVFLVTSRERARGVGWLLLAVVPALLVVPAVSDVYGADPDEGARSIEVLRDAGRAALAGALLALVAGAGAALAGRRVEESAERQARANRAVAGGAVGVVVVGLVAFAVVTSDPFGWVGDRVDEFLTQGTPHSDEVSSRFSSGAGSERDDLWRVALDDAGEDPILGLGAGGYQYSYLLDRDEEGIESVRDAHSVEFEVLSELGVIGLVLFACAIGGAALGAWRSRGLGVPAAALSTCALTAGAYWLSHASLDWFWTYAGVTAPVFALIGSACAPGPSRSERPAGGPWRRVGMVAVAVLAISMVPIYLSERYVDAAYDGWRTDPARADRDLDRARDLNPFSIEPLLAEGGIAKAAGDREQAIAAFEEAAEKRPEEWATHYFLATLYIKSDFERAKDELDQARALNPHSIDIRLLGERLEEVEDRQ
jgi:O-Antigen ligase